MVEAYTNYNAQQGAVENADLRFGCAKLTVINDDD